MVEAAGVDPSRLTENTQVIDSSRTLKTLDAPDWANHCTRIARRADAGLGILVSRSSAALDLHGSRGPQTPMALDV